MIKPRLYEELTPVQRRNLRMSYVHDQNGLCFYCGGDLFDRPPEEIRTKEIDWDLFPPNFLKYDIHLQHSHETGLTEGAVHALCNAVMWQYEGR